MAATEPEGMAVQDKDFGPGKDSVTYRMNPPWG